MSSLAKPVLSSVVAVLASIQIVQTRPLLKPVFILLATVSAGYSLERLQDRSLKEIAQGVRALSKEMLGLMPVQSDRPASVKLVLQGDVEALLAGAVKDIDQTTPDFWTPDRAKRSAVLLGNRGSGKSQMQAFRVQQKLAAGVKVWISDIHRNANIRSGRDKTDWIPGVNEEDFQKRYLVPTAGKTLEVLKAFRTEAHERLYEGKKWAESWDLTIDEWQAVWSQWSEAEQETAIKCFNAILDEADKVGIQVSVTLHSLTREKTGLDGSLINGCDLYVFGGALSNSTNKLPTDMDRKALGKEKAEAAIALAIQQRAVVYRDNLSTESFVVVSPDLSVEFQFEPAPADEDVWLQENRALIEDMWLQGRSGTAIAEYLKIPVLNRDPRYQKLKGLLEELKDESEEDAA